MGFSASQARYLALVSRMSDIEYQGQQINQERTTLSNQVNDLYNSLLSMSVPTPPSTNDFTKVEYTFSMGATNYTISNIRPDGANYYSVNLSYDAVGHYLSQLSNHRITRDEYDNYYVGSIEDNIQLGSLTDALDVQISQDDMNEYLEAMRNYFPEYANIENPNELMSKFMVYFTQEGTETIPHFVKVDDVNHNVHNNDEGWVPVYDYMSNGTYEATRHYDDCTLTFDTQGLIAQIGIPIYDGAGEVMSRTTYNLRSTTVTDQEAYNNAFNEYESAKYKYDKEQAAINAKTSIIQQEDKNLELKLTRLDHERSAVNTELDAVKKVIDDSIEKGFKTFSG